MKFLLTGAVVVLALAGCASFQPAEESDVTRALWQERQQRLDTLEAWDIRARAALTWRNKAYYVNLSWQHKADGETLLLETPLGQAVARLDSLADGRYRLRLPDGNEIIRDSAEQLFKEVFGWALPVSGLIYWIRGIPRPDSAHGRRLDQSGRARSLYQDGWNLDYSRYFDDTRPADLPRRIVLGRDSLEIKLVIERWQAVEIAPVDESLFPDFNQ